MTDPNGLDPDADPREWPVDARPSTRGDLSRPVLRQQWPAVRAAAARASRRAVLFAAVLVASLAPMARGRVALAGPHDDHLAPAATGSAPAPDEVPTSEPSRGLGLSSETVHKFYGAAILGLSTSLLVEETGAFEAPSLLYAVPGLVLASGGLLAIDPLLHGSAGPTNYGAETRQHLILGGLLLVVGSLDLAYEARWLDHWTWGLALPAGMLAASTSFLFHAQHGAPSQHELLGAQHRILGATLAVAAIAKGLSVVPTAEAADGEDRESRWPELRPVWMAAAGLAGIQLLLYTEGTPTGAGKSSHGRHSSSYQVGFTGRGIALLGAF